MTGLYIKLDCGWTLDIYILIKIECNQLYDVTNSGIRLTLSLKWGLPAAGC